MGHGSVAWAQQPTSAEAAASKAEQARLADTDTLLAEMVEKIVMLRQQV